MDALSKDLLEYIVVHELVTHPPALILFAKTSHVNRRSVFDTYDAWIDTLMQRLALPHLRPTTCFQHESDDRVNLTSIGRLIYLQEGCFFTFMSATCTSTAAPRRRHFVNNEYYYELPLHDKLAVCVCDRLKILDLMVLDLIERIADRQDRLFSYRFCKGELVGTMARRRFSHHLVIAEPASSRPEARC